MKTAQTWDDIETGKVSKEAINDPYIQAFAQDLMLMSNDMEYFSIDEISDKYLPCIREFIANVTGL